MAESSGNGSVCAMYEGYTNGRFAVIMIASLVSSIGLVINCFLLRLFTEIRKQLLAILALLDCLLCLLYVLLFGVDALNVYAHVNLTFHLWSLYIFPCFMLSRIVQLVIPYILIFATIERLIWLSGTKNRFLTALVAYRGQITVGLVVFGVLLRSPMYWAFQIDRFPNCPVKHRSMQVAPNDLYFKESYYLYDFYFIAFVQLLLPFALLVTLNGITLHKLWHTHKLSMTLGTYEGRTKVDWMTKYSTRKGHCKSALMLLNHTGYSVARRISAQLYADKKKMRRAVYTMSVVCATYIVCNSLHLFLTILERTKSTILVDDEIEGKSSTFYVVLSDTVSILYMLCSVIRFFVYYKCNPEIQTQIRIRAGAYKCNREVDSPLLNKKISTRSVGFGAVSDIEMPNTGIE